MKTEDLKYYFNDETLDKAVDCLMFETQLGKQVQNFNDAFNSEFAITYSPTSNSIRVWKYPEYLDLFCCKYDSVPGLIKAVRRSLEFGNLLKMPHPSGA